LYEAHYGLNERPFGETTSSAAYVSLPSRDAVVRRLHYALAHDLGPAMLIGPPGSGKTIVARRTASELSERPVHVTFPALSPPELLAHLASEFGHTAQADPSPHLALRFLRDHFVAMAKNGDRPLVIVDDAHLIRDVASFDVFRLLLNFNSTGRPDLALLLVGGPELVLDLSVGLADRLATRSLLGPFTEEESATYILGRLGNTDARDHLFTRGALSSLHQAADGLPRRLNRLADLALLIAYAQDRATVDDFVVQIATRELNRDAA
jgi:type II secretory pathway predicted ATPase ExeA